MISSCCHNLLELELKNAWLSVDGLNPMLKLTNLTLEFIRLQDEDLTMVNYSFPYLQVLNLIGVGGLKEPKIHLLHLKACLWEVSKAPLSLTIDAPNLVKLKLKCIRPKSFLLDASLLSDVHFNIERANKVKVKEFRNLKNLQLESVSLFNLIDTFHFGNTIKKLKLESTISSEPVLKKLGMGMLFDAFPNMSLLMGMLFDAFPNMSSLTLGPLAWSEIETCFQENDFVSKSMGTNLKEFIAHVIVVDVNITLSFIFSVLDTCTKLSDMALLIHRDIDSKIGSNLISRCTIEHPGVRWRWGMWKQGMEDSWVSDGILFCSHLQLWTKGFYL